MDGDRSPLAEWCTRRIPVQRMSHLREVWKTDEDWAGMTNSKERRKLQNRLNQRAYRRRKLSATKGSVWRVTRPPAPFPFDTLSLPCEPDIEQRQEETHGAATKFNLIRRYSEQAYARYLGRDTCPESLLTVVQINVFNALAGNSSILGLSTAWVVCESISPFGQGGSSFSQDTKPLSCPENLRPTALQMSTPHHPWLDLLPWPELRDTILRLSVKDLIDEDDLCCDIVEFDAFVSATEKATLIVWGEPWDPRGWEASVAFLRKWGWILNGCGEILEATNHWRERRGEKRLALPQTLTW